MSDGVNDHGYPEDGNTIFQDIGASKAPQSDCPATPVGSPSDYSARPAAARLDIDEMAVPGTASE